LTCNPLTELKIPDWTGLQVSSAAVVMVGDSTSLQCWNSSLVAGNSSTFNISCLTGGIVAHNIVKILTFLCIYCTGNKN
jgi:hypothetical protein